MKWPAGVKRKGKQMRKILVAGVVLAVIAVMVVLLMNHDTGTYAKRSDISWNYSVIDGDVTILRTPVDGDVVIPDRLGGCPVKKIGDGAFSESDIASVTFPDTITHIGTVAFMDCTKLEVVKIPDDVRSIGAEAFRGTGFWNRQPEGIVTLDGWVLGTVEECPFDVVLPRDIKGVAVGAFAYRQVSTVMIPESVKHICEGAFRGCYKLETLTVSPNNPNYSSRDGILFTKDMRSLLAFPSGRQGAYAVPDGVTRLGDGAFSWSELTSVKIPDSVASIGKEVFENCRSLKQISTSRKLKDDEALLRMENKAEIVYR